MASPRGAPRAAEPAPRRAPFLARVIATGAGTGRIPWAPGTAGSAAALLIAIIPGVSSTPALAALVLAGFLAGRWAAGLVAEADGGGLARGAAAAQSFFGRTASPHPDPSVVVIDEMVGMWISLLLLPPEPATWVVAFVTFRAFDTVKPPPVARLERFGGGWGIMLDDVAAGVYANLATRVTLWIVG